MPVVTLEKVLEDVRQLDREDQEKLRLMLNGTPIFTGSAPALPIKPRIIATDLPIKDRSKEHEWLHQHRDEYANQWVALDGDRLLSRGKDFKEVINQARNLGIPDALMIYVEPSNAPPFVMW